MKLIKTPAIALALAALTVMPVYATEPETINIEKTTQQEEVKEEKSTSQDGKTNQKEEKATTQESVDDKKEESKEESTKENTRKKDKKEETKEDTKKETKEDKKEDEKEETKVQVLKEEDTAIEQVITSSNILDLSEQREQRKEELEELKTQLTEINDKLSEYDNKASELNEEIHETNNKLNEAKGVYNNQYKDMKTRIQYMYENNDTNIESIFLSSKDMGDVLNSVSYYQTLYDYDREKLGEMENTYNQINEYTNTLNSKAEEIEELKKNAEEEQEKLKKLVKEKEDAIKLLETDMLDASNYALQSQVLGGGNDAATQVLLERARLAQEQALKDGTATPLQVKVAQNAGAGNSTFPALYNWCAAWVSGVYSYSGITPSRGNAIDYWNKWSSSGSSDYTTTPIGAAVISSSHPVYGHIGIYLGGGVVASNLGYVKIETIESFGSTRSVCQGKQGFVGWVWPNNNDLSKK